MTTVATNPVGYLTIFDTTTLINHTTKRATNQVGNTSIANILVYKLPNGTKVSYNGTADAKLTPGRATQDITLTAGGETLAATLIAKVGNYGALTFAKLSSASALLTNKAYLESVQDITEWRTHGTAHMRIRVTFELLEDWTIVV